MYLGLLALQMISYNKLEICFSLQSVKSVYNESNKPFSSYNIEKALRSSTGTVDDLMI
jgi:hypothetical protein